MWLHVNDWFLLESNPFLHFCVQESDLCFLHLRREFDSICLFHNFSSLFCLGSIGKTHRQYIFSKTAVQLAWVPRDFLCAVSGLVKPFKVTRVESFFSRGFASSDFCLRPKICWPAATPKHPAAPEKNPLVTRVRFNTTLSQYRLVFYSGHSDVSKSNGHLFSHGCSKVPRGVWGYSREFLVGVNRQVLKILTLFHTKKMLFPTPVSDPSLKSIPIFRPGIEFRLELKRDFLKSISNSLTTLSSWFIWSWNDNYIYIYIY